MAKISRLDVTYINNTAGVYRAGQLLEGVVTLETTKKFSVKGKMAVDVTYVGLLTVFVGHGCRCAAQSA